MELSLDMVIEQAQADLPPLPPPAPAAPRMSKEEYSAMKQEERQTLAAIRSAALEMAFIDGEGFVNFLEAQTCFPAYSAGNVLLINAQNPGATHVESFDGWRKAEFERSIRTGEKGIGIIVPHEYEAERNGEAFTALGFNVGYVYDVSQTVGKEMPQSERRTVNPDIYLTALLKTSRFRVIPKDALTQSNIHDPQRDMRYILTTVDNSVPVEQGAVYDPSTRVLQMRSDMTDRQSATALTRCLAMDTLAVNKPSDNTPYNATLEANGVAYIVMRRFGVDMPRSNFKNFDASVYQGIPANLHGALDRIRSASSTLCERVRMPLEQTSRGKSALEVR